MSNFRFVGKPILGTASLLLLFVFGGLAQAAASQTLFTTQTPASPNQSDGAGTNYELGTLLQSNTAGQITAVRFWKDAKESGPHTGRIWSGTGQLMASVTFASETTSGWQQQSLATPISIAANTTYVVSVNTGATFYVVSVSGLSSQVVNGNLHSVVGNNGVYGSPGAFPTNSWQASNYFRDVVFVPTTGTTTYNISGTIGSLANGPGTTVTLSGAASATVTADSSGNYTFTGLANGNYTVTPTKAGFTFSPATASATVNNANITALNFTATAVATYSISGTIGSPANGPGTTVTLSGAASATATANSSGNYAFTGLANGSYTVTPTKAGFTFNPASAPVSVNNANATVATFTATASAAGQTLFTTQVPALLSQTDGAGMNYELGALLQSNTAGQITAVRFWKDAKESGTHTGYIWSGTGQLLASVTFVSESASGWQQQALATPLAIAAGTTYVVSVNTGNAYYVATTSGLALQVVNGNLSSVVGNDGVYGAAGTYPTGSYQSSNYFRDVVFVPVATNVAPTITTQPSSQSITAGQTATFNVAVTGTSPMTYQWMKNSTAITGATSSSYTTPAETTSDNNAKFSVRITNSIGSATSNSATLTVSAGTLILNGSTSALNFGNVTAPGSSTLNVTLTNTGTSNVAISSVSISGAGFGASGVPAGLIMSPGQTATLVITFTPAATGSVTGSVTVTSNATNSPDKITLSGTGLAAATHSASLSWIASTSTVVGYNCYSSTVSGGPYTKLTATPKPSTSYTDSTVQAGKTYYYVVTSVDSNNVESTYSNEISATIP